MFSRSPRAPVPVLNYSAADRWWTCVDLFDASHPSIAPHSAARTPLEAVSLLCRRRWEEKGFLSTRQLIDEVEGASLDRRCRGAAPCRCANVPPFLLSSAASHPTTPTHPCSSLHKDSRWVSKGHGNVLNRAPLLNSDLVKGPHPPPSTAPLIARGWLHSALLPRLLRFQRVLASFQWEKAGLRTTNYSCVYRQAPDDYHGKLTTGWGSCNLPVESHGSPPHPRFRSFFFTQRGKWLSIPNRLSLV